MKKLWQQTAPLVLSGLILSALAGGWRLVWLEIDFHRHVNEQLTALVSDDQQIKEKLGIQTKEKEPHVAINN